MTLNHTFAVCVCTESRPDRAVCLMDFNVLTRGSEAWWNATTPVDSRFYFIFFSSSFNSLPLFLDLTWLNKYNFYRNIIINLCSISGKAHIVQCQFNLLFSYRRHHIVWPSNVIFIHSILFEFIARRCFCIESTIKQDQKEKRT